jgi:hypothetical protein
LLFAESNFTKPIKFYRENGIIINPDAITDLLKFLESNIAE